MEVDSATGEVRKNQWEDCRWEEDQIYHLSCTLYRTNIAYSSDCPGTQFPCTEEGLFNADGVCVSQRRREEIEANVKSTFPGIYTKSAIHSYYPHPSLSGFTLPFKFDGSSARSGPFFAPAPACPAKGEILKSKTCRCTDDVPKGEEGNCKPSRGPFDDNGWCYLEHVEDHKTPQKVRGGRTGFFYYYW